MPQKRNPVPIEHLRHLASVSAGRCDTIINTMHNTPFTDMNDSEGEVQQAGYAVFHSGGRMLKLLTAFIPACQINADRVASNSDAACITITELADTLVREEGLNFRQAHEIAATTARSVIADEIPLGQGYKAFTEAFENEIKRTSKLTKDRFQTVTSAQHFVKVRNRTGGPAPDALAEAFTGYCDELTTLIQRRIQRHERHTLANQSLDVAFTDLLKD